MHGSEENSLAPRLERPRVAALAVDPILAASMPRIESGAPPAGGPNANAVRVTATFWIERVKDQHGNEFDQLRYTQRRHGKGNGVTAAYTLGAHSRARPRQHRHAVTLLCRHLCWRTPSKMRTGLRLQISKPRSRPRWGQTAKYRRPFSISELRPRPET